MSLDWMGGMNMITILGLAGMLLGLGLAGYGVSTWLKRSKTITSRMDHFVAASVETTSIRPLRQIVPREISGSLLSRTIIRWFNAVLQFLGRFTPEKMAVDLEHKLGIAGHPANLHAANFYALRFLLLVAGVVMALFANRDFQNIDQTSILLGLAIVALSMIFPGVWLKNKMRARQSEISRGLPDALDMLSVCASAGLGFDQSIQKIAGYWETVFGHELRRVTQEMEMGLTRSEALRNMSGRLDVDDLSRFIAIIIQAEKIGMSYADVLHGQALQMRVLRQYRAREIANKLPAKLIVPVALFIFPALLAVIMGPAIPILMNLF